MQETDLSRVVVVECARHHRVSEMAAVVAEHRRQLVEHRTQPVEHHRDWQLVEHRSRHWQLVEHRKPDYEVVPQYEALGSCCKHAIAGLGTKLGGCGMMASIWMHSRRKLGT